MERWPPFSSSPASGLCECCQHLRPHVLRSSRNSRPPQAGAQRCSVRRDQGSVPPASILIWEPQQTASVSRETGRLRGPVLVSRETRGTAEECATELVAGPTPRLRTAPSARWETCVASCRLASSSSNIAGFSACPTYSDIHSVHSGLERRDPSLTQGFFARNPPFAPHIKAAATRNHSQTRGGELSRSHFPC